MGTWALYIPYVKTKFALNDAQLGNALFCLALGGLLFLPFVPVLTRRWGEGRFTLIGVCCFALSFLLIFLGDQFWILCGALFVVGIFSTSTDVAMNALVSQIERHDQVSVMSASHGFFSLGGVIGAGIGSFLLVKLDNPMIHFIVVGIPLIVMNVYLAKNYWKIKDDSIKEKTSINWRQVWPLTGLALVAFVIMTSEGAAEHWSNLYMLDVVGVPSGKLAGLGFIAFSMMMTLGRFFGDGLNERFGSIRVILMGIGLACIGYLFILTGQMIFTILGFAICGLGLSVIIPEVFRIAGSREGVSSSMGISYVSGIGIFGFMFGPVILGHISSLSNLRISFASLLAMCILAFIYVFFTMRKA